MCEERVLWTHVHYYNKVAISMVRALRGADTPEDALRAHVQQLKGEISRMPPHEEILRTVLSNPIYKRSTYTKVAHILKRLERGLRDRFDEEVSVNGTLWIEHIMPQSWTEYWPLPNGRISPYEDTLQALLAGQHLDPEDSELIQRRSNLIHTLGNLTLLSAPANQQEELG